MISGLGFFEILIIFLVILMFFGSKELPHFIRESARMIGKLRRYSDKVRRELNEVTDITRVDETFDDNDVNVLKKKIRDQCLEARKALTREEHTQKSGQVAGFLFDTEEFKKARTILMYVATRTEVQTLDCIEQVLNMDKRVVLPYTKSNSSEMGIAEIKDITKDVCLGQYKMLEPCEELRDNFLKSDIQLVVSPGVGFDKNGARLGRGKGCYDYFLKEIKGKAPIAAFAYQCQVLDEDLPFDYHDIPVDMLITEEGVQRFG